MAEAIETSEQLIVIASPILFRGAKRLSRNDTEASCSWPLARGGHRRLFAAHRVRQFARRHQRHHRLPARLDWRGATATGKSDQQYKIVGIRAGVGPGTSLRCHVRGRRGTHRPVRQCSFRLAGTGTFFGSDATNPTVVKKADAKKSAEWRSGSRLSRTTVHARRSRHAKGAHLRGARLRCVSTSAKIRAAGHEGVGRSSGTRPVPA